MGVPVPKMTASERRSFWAPARPYPRNRHAVGFLKKCTMASLRRRTCTIVHEVGLAGNHGSLVVIIIVIIVIIVITVIIIRGIIVRQVGLAGN